MGYFELKAEDPAVSRNTFTSVHDQQEFRQKPWPSKTPITRSNFISERLIYVARKTHDYEVTRQTHNYQVTSALLIVPWISSHPFEAPNPTSFPHSYKLCGPTSLWVFYFGGSFMCAIIFFPLHLFYVSLIITSAKEPRSTWRKFFCPYVQWHPPWFSRNCHEVNDFLM